MHCIICNTILPCQVAEQEIKSSKPHTDIITARQNKEENYQCNESFIKGPDNVRIQFKAQIKLFVHSHCSKMHASQLACQQLTIETVENKVDCTSIQYTPVCTR